jgi:hypothetical protein
VVEHGTPGAIPEGLLNNLDPVLVNGEVDLYRVPGVPLEWNDVPPTVPVIGADLLAVGGVAGCCVAAAVVRPKASVADTVPTT